MNTLAYRMGMDFKILNKLNTLMMEAKELQVNDLEVSMLEHFLHHFHEYLDYCIVEAHAEGKNIFFDEVVKSLKVLKAYLSFALEGNISLFLKLYAGLSSNMDVVGLMPDLHKALEEFYYHESSSLRKIRFSKCTASYLHILRLRDIAFEKYVIRDIKACITFPFAKLLYHEYYEKIYAYTMQWVTNPNEDRLISIGEAGNLYDVDIEKLLVDRSLEQLDYPTCDFFYRNKKINFQHLDWICNIKNPKVILRCRHNPESIYCKDFNKDFLKYLPCILLDLIIEIYGDLEYFAIE